MRLQLGKKIKRRKWSPVVEFLGRVAAEFQGSAEGAEFAAQGSLLFMGGTEAEAPHGSTGAAGAEPAERGRGSVLSE